MSLAFAILNIFLSLSCVSNSTYKSFIASTWAVPMALFAALFACLYLSLSSCFCDVSLSLSESVSPGGVCADGLDLFTCTCAAGYMGANCDVGKITFSIHELYIVVVTFMGIALAFISRC